MSSIKKNSLHAWFLASRPKTLTAAVLPVVAAAALAYSHGAFRWIPFLLCMAFAGLMQIAANLINDLFDYLKGTDREDRLGPERACAQGWIGTGAMRWGILTVIVSACTTGLFLLAYGDPLLMVGIGVLCVVFAFLYTTLLSYCGFGDLLVWLFFGFVPVAGTYYVQAGTVDAPVWWLAAGCGLVTDTLLVLNNYRDRDTDRRSHKRTLIVVWGERFGSLYYLIQGVLGYLCVAMLAFYGHVYAAVIPLLYLIPHVQTWRTMVRINKGRELNRVLGLTSRNIVIFALLSAVSLIV